MEFDKDTLVRMYNEGLTVRQIACKFNVNYNSMRNIMKSLSIELNRQNSKRAYYTKLVGSEKIIHRFFTSKKYSAAKQKHIWNITKEFLWYLYTNQNKKCALSGIDIYFPQTPKDYNTGNYNLSIDRIDSNLGYTEDNVQLVHKDINLMKLDLSMKDFLYFAKLIYENNL